MSATTAPSEAQIALAAYDRTLAETRKFSAEMNKLTDESLKLRAEASKLRRDYTLAPWVIVVSSMGTGAALFAAAFAFAKLFHA
jgi:hypothetical protein